MAHFVDKDDTYDKLLKSVRADPALWRRRLGYDGNITRLEQEVAELRRKLDFIEKITPPPPHRFAVQNGHTARRTP